ncbi:MAG: type II toxin-antitoxin system RelE/ParE family toxin [Burkholderiaceae bacterium]|nr:type II toxin-antitoxin system RelE/ParE family toxin [Burkholderiaceae bacterium]
MAVVILPGAADDLLELQDYMLAQWDQKLWLKAEDEIFDKLEKADQGLLKGMPIRELVQLGITDYKKIITSHHSIVLRRIDDDTYVYLVAGQKQDFKSLLFRRLMNSV